MSEISHRNSCPHTLEQNELAERKHLHIVDMAESHVPKQYWFHAFATLVFLINRLFTRTLKNLSPYEKLFNQSPAYNDLKSFGCAYYPCLFSYNSNKLDYRSIKCVFIGSSLNHRGYRFLDLTTERIYLSLIFDEDSLSFLSLPDPLQVPLSVNHKSQWPSPPHNQPPIQPSQIPTPIPTSTSNPTHHEVTNIQPPSPDYHLTNFLSTTQITPSTTSNMIQWGPSQDNTSAPLASPSPQPQ